MRLGGCSRFVASVKEGYLTILVVDDDPSIREVLRVFLEREGFEVVEAADGASALASAPGVDLVVLDLMLPELSGWEVAKVLLRDRPELRIVILTARNTENERVYGLELGADDYVVKPFSAREVVARIKSLLRRAGLSDQLRYGELSIQLGTRDVYLRGTKLLLSKLEFELLVTLAQHPGLAWSRTRLLERVWGGDFPGNERVVDSRIAILRRKLDDASEQPRYIETVHGVGYRFIESS